MPSEPVFAVIEALLPTAALRTADAPIIALEKALSTARPDECRSNVARLRQGLHTTMDRGNAMVGIEHSREVMETADWVIDMGPEGGVVVETLEQIGRSTKTHTSRFLHDRLAHRPPPPVVTPVSANGRKAAVRASSS